MTSSGLPESNAGHIMGFLFGLAPGGVYLAAKCYHSRGALLPHPFTLTESKDPAVYSLLHFPWAHAPQGLPGTLPYGARTFLPSSIEDRRLFGQLWGQTRRVNGDSQRRFCKVWFPQIAAEVDCRTRSAQGARAHVQDRGEYIPVAARARPCARRS